MGSSRFGWVKRFLHPLEKDHVHAKKNVRPTTFSNAQVTGRLKHRGPLWLFIQTMFFFPYQLIQTMFTRPCNSVLVILGCSDNPYEL